MKKFKIAVLDDYQQVAEILADWNEVKSLAEVTIYSDHLSEESDLVSRLFDFEIICVMRERTPLTASLLNKLTNLKLVVSTGRRNASIDLVAATALGVEIIHTEYLGNGAHELTWALILAAARHIPTETANMKNGNWQTTIGTDLYGKTIGIVGLGTIGAKMAQIAKAFDMEVIAWSENLTTEKAEACGARLVSKEELFKLSDFVTVHLVLSDRSRGVVGKDQLALMKPTAFLINTSRGPLVNEQALIETLENKRIAGAGIDVYDEEPVNLNHPFRKLKNIIATPHIGFVTQDTFKLFYTDIVNILTIYLQKK